jgi:hypothetical protein
MKGNRKGDTEERKEGSEVRKRSEARKKPMGGMKEGR